MPPRKVRTNANVEDAQSSSDEEAPRPSPTLMSGDQLASFLTAFAKSQAEVNRQLVESLMASHATGSARPSPTPSSTCKTGNMSKCTARFDGHSRDPEVVEAFIDSVEIYKECASVPDDLALRGLPMLLHGEAAVWFRGVKASLTSWDDALAKLRAMFGVPRPPHKVGEPTPFAEHHIDTGDHPPIAVPPYRVTPAKKEVMRIELDKMLAECVIEECESAWSAPTVLVPKSNGGYRVCVDYRRLNAVTKTDAYPMPRIDELLQSTKRSCVMSTCDLRSGYWQCKVKDKDKTAFVTPFGLPLP
ncbi:hypothetical protein B5X24_HaOG208204 [Helicoverpa armigera]|uniref:Reverse transcriptase domain-containing protein n=1 Tax=Helicoverpa armigera TaxID=29058 RepID=A0A2W1BGD6_HELAM|nr:hypothetical protein B5X24_HaOG208204 [Helicoverpa armigera]